MDSISFYTWFYNNKFQDQYNFELYMTNRASKVVYMDKPIMLFNRNDLDSPYWRGIFFHELGHIANPVDKKWRNQFRIFKLIELLQVVTFFPVFHLIAKTAPLGLSYHAAFISLVYMFKFALNYWAKPLTAALQENEFQADNFSKNHDSTKSLEKKYTKNFYSLLIKDILVRISPGFVLLTHPMTYLRLQALTK